MITRSSAVSRILTAVALCLGAAVLAACGVSDTKPVPAPTADKGTAVRARTTYLVDCPDNAMREPKTVVLTCADANQSVENLVWSDWGSDRADATGTVSINLCEPSCAAGKRASYDVKVVASDLVVGKSSATYGKLTVTALGDHPSGTRKVESFKLYTTSPHKH